MQNVVIGTAGHVDHGKTCLIKALTGTDTDRLKEEKKRGITIDLGFADMPNENNLNISIIDVPGHEKFVKNMLAGIGGIDFVLFVIAADESIMPQTIEHFQIINMLGIEKGIVVITKVDTVEEDWLEVVREDVKDYIKGTFLEYSPMLEVSSYTGQNIDVLKDAICKMALGVNLRKQDKALFRIPIDRVFTIDGFGTVITGTLMEGNVNVGDEVEIYPNGIISKVRNLQVHGKKVDVAYAGQRTAMNLAGIKKDEIKRGQVIAYKNCMNMTDKLDVKISVFKDSQRIIENGTRLHFYCGSSEILCKAILLDTDLLSAGESGYVQLKFEEKISFRKGDKFIIRFYSPVETIGGGVIIDASPTRKKRYDEKTLNALKIKNEGSHLEVLEQIYLEQSVNITNIKDVSLKTQWNLKDTSQYSEELLEMGKIINLNQDINIHKEYYDKIVKLSYEVLNKFHKQNPISQGMLKEEFRSKLSNLIHIKDIKKIDIVIKKLIENNIVNDYGSVISDFNFKINYSDEQLKLKSIIENIYMNSKFEIPDIEDVQEKLSDKYDKNLTKQMIEVLYGEKILEKITFQYYIHCEWMKKAYEILDNHLKSNENISLAQFRDYIKTSRKYAIILLEYFDEKKITILKDGFRSLLKY